MRFRLRTLLLGLGAMPAGAGPLNRTGPATRYSVHIDTLPPSAIISRSSDLARKYFDAALDSLKSRRPACFAESSAGIFYTETPVFNDFGQLIAVVTKARIDTTRFALST